MEAFSGEKSTMLNYELFGKFEEEHLQAFKPDERAYRSIDDLFIGARLSRHALLAAMQSSQDQYEWPNDRFELVSAVWKEARVDDELLEQMGSEVSIPPIFSSAEKMYRFYD